MTGLVYKKFDLHMHTPASEDYKDKKVKPEELVKRAKEVGLDGIAVTDHQSAEWIDPIKKEADKVGIVVFPGVELLLAGGEEGVHLLILFDQCHDGNHVVQFLNKIGIYNKNGKKTLAVDKTVFNVLEELSKYDPSAVAILAHCQSSKGVLSEMRGETRKKIFEPRLHNLIGVETSESDFKSEDKIKNKKRVIDILNGNDPNYHNRKLGVIQSSDSHSLGEIGRAFTYFKVDSPITIEDIRQSLIDRDVRIRQPHEFSETQFPRILRIKVLDGFLKDQIIELHSGLNSILGSKGSGKSLVIELLRFGLNQQPEILDLKKDHESKLQKCLKLYGKVEIDIADENGKMFKISREYNPQGDNPYKIEDLADGSLKEISIEEYFPILFLSQNEIIKIAEDQSGDSQRGFIDNFFDFYKFRRDIERLNIQLLEKDKILADALRASIQVDLIHAKINVIKEEIKKLDVQIKNEVFDEFSKKEKVGEGLTLYRRHLERLKQNLEDTFAECDGENIPEIDDLKIQEMSSIKRAKEISVLAKEGVIAKLKETIRVVNTQIASIEREYLAWQADFAPTKTQYEQVVKEAGGSQLKLNNKRQEHIKELAKIESELVRYQGRSQNLKNIAEQRQKNIQELEGVYKEYFNARKERCDFFTEESDGVLKVEVQESKDNTNFKNNLLKFKKGSWLKDEEIEAISQNISAKEFISDLLNYERSRRKKTERLHVISERTGIKEDNIKKLADHLLDEYSYEDILALLYKGFSKDVPVIRYKVESEYKLLSELSVGQKATALLIMALSEGNFPIIIDQPEDSLDLRSIWEDVCLKLRGHKDNRQFVLTTHNSSVAVASDSDKFTILVANATSARVLHSGSINKTEVKKEVITYLEGGEATYSQKRSKYGL